MVRIGQNNTEIVMTCQNKCNLSKNIASLVGFSMVW